MSNTLKIKHENNVIKFKFIDHCLNNILSCKKNDENSPSEEIKIEYPIKLIFKEEGESKLEYWKGGTLKEMPANDYTKYFSEDCLKYFNEETDVFCKNTKITFLDDKKLKLIFDSNKELNFEYEFINDTLKIVVEKNTIASGVGSIDELKIYGNISKYESENQSQCGGDEYLKHNFNGQFFLSAHENHKLPIDKPEDMNTEDEVVFYNKEYILKQ